MSRETNTYELTIPKEFWGEELTRFYQAKSAGAAKYEYWLRFADCYNMTFGDFVKMIKCRKVG